MIHVDYSGVDVFSLFWGGVGIVSAIIIGMMGYETPAVVLMVVSAAAIIFSISMCPSGPL